jgi:hypothetical protein
MRYILQVRDLATARGKDPDLAFNGATAETFAAALQSALRTSALFERWRAKQPEPDEVDPSLGATDAGASVSARGDDSLTRTDIDVRTSLPHSILRQRMNWLVGDRWALSDVK